jgi:hypothetical protein
MLRKVIALSVVLMGLLVGGRVSAFTLFGPPETWQTDTLDYPGDVFIDLTFVAQDTTDPTFFGLQIGATKQLTEEYRLNTPIVTYAYDTTFLEYFGTEGVKAVDSAFAFINAIPAASKMSSDLSEYLTEGNYMVNYRAQALKLVDMKSLMIQLLVEHMGLGGETHVFDLSSRTETTTNCVYRYTVLKRNYDPITWEPSAYVNGRQWTYRIQDDCSSGYASAVEVAPSASGKGDTSAETQPFTSVATPYTLKAGYYYLSLTRDDLGGLRYLYRKNNFNYETLTTNSSAPTVSSSTSSSPWSIPSFFLTNSSSSTTTTTTTETNAPVLRGGMEKIKYVKLRYDSLIGTSFTPITVKYSLPVLVRNKVVSQKVTRYITAPDILIRAEDFIDVIYAGGALTTSSTTSMGGNSPIGNAMLVYRDISYENTVTNKATSVLNETAGPGIIYPGFNLVFNKVGPAEYTYNHYFESEGDAYGVVTLGVFDGSTNDPIVFPSGTSIRDLEAQVLSDETENSDIGDFPSTWSADIIDWLNSSSSSSSSSGTSSQ